MTENGGHLFVIHGDLTLLNCDGLLIPTDDNLVISDHWHAFLGGQGPTRPQGWGANGVRVTAPLSLDGRLCWFANTGIPSDDMANPAYDIGWLLEGVRQAVTAAASALKAPESLTSGRALPLIGMPVFGVGNGGFARERGNVLDELLTLLTALADDLDVDLALVARSRADYEAVQARRRRTTPPVSISPEVENQARQVGGHVSAGRAALFLGAGLSAAAGLPDWNGLLNDLAQVAYPGDEAMHAELRELPPVDSATILRTALGDKFSSVLRRQLQRDRHALGHSLVASLRVRECVTTNYDQLYEQSAAVPFGKRLKVLPREEATPADPWLLKMHGDIERGTITLARDDYLSYDVHSRPLASVVQALLLTKHMVFVGFSLTDDNFFRLIRDVIELNKLVDRKGPIGTAILPTSARAQQILWQGKLSLVAASNESVGSSASYRTLEILLDRIAMYASDGHSYLLDRRYGSLLEDDDRQAAEAIRSMGSKIPKEGQAWASLRNALQDLGGLLDDSPDSQPRFAPRPQTMHHIES